MRGVRRLQRRDRLAFRKEVSTYFDRLSRPWALILKLHDALPSYDAWDASVENIRTFHQAGLRSAAIVMVDQPAPYLTKRLMDDLFTPSGIAMAFHDNLDSAWEWIKSRREEQ